jgi:hypothetical protein
MSPFLFFKVPETDATVQADITSMLIGAETITNVMVGNPQPVSPVPLAVTLASAVTSPQIQLNLAGGNDGVSYGTNLTITTSARVLIVTVVVTAQDPSAVPYTTQNPDAFQDLVDQIEAGNAAIGSCVFAFPPAIDPSGGFVTWELLASDGTVYAAGNAYEYTVNQNGISNNVIAKSVISVPSNVPPSLDGQRYQLRYTLEIPQAIGTPSDPTTGKLSQNVFFQFENLRIVGFSTVPLGTQPSVELQGVPATLSIVVDKPYDNMTVELWNGGTQIAPPSAIQEYERTADGWAYSGVIDTAQLGVSLVPYTVVWKYWASTNAAVIFQESADLFVINPSIMTAVRDVKSKINKARTTLYGHPDLLYPEATVLTWLRRGGDAFNGAYGYFSNFTFTNALGSIREFWLLESEMAAIQSQYIAEAEKAFDFQGAAISLNVDRTSFLDSAAQTIQTRLDSELMNLKKQLIIKGATSGDGSVNPMQLQRGAIGAVGVTITPASMWGRYTPYYGITGVAK